MTIIITLGRAKIIDLRILYTSPTSVTMFNLIVRELRFVFN